MSTDELIAREVVVRGRVQGVLFRESCRREALAAGVAGWVRNEADGSVRAVLEGPARSVERVVAWMRSGPPLASVAELEVTAATPMGRSGFDVG